MVSQQIIDLQSADQLYFYDLVLSVLLLYNYHMSIFLIYATETIVAVSATCGVIAKVFPIGFVSRY